MAVMQVTEVALAGWHLVTVTGRIDSSTAESLAAPLRSAVTTHSQVAVDCAAVDFISSAGIGALVEGAVAARNAGKRFSICRPSSRVAEMLKLCRLDTLLTIESALPGT